MPTSSLARSKASSPVTTCSLAPTKATLIERPP
jgi:hypothetical protein